MFYVTMADLTGMIPGPFLIQALDDDSDGAADPAAWNSVAKDASDAVDGVLGGRFTVPFSNPLPAVVIAAAKLFAAEQIYARRGKSAQENPFTKQATEMRAKLEATTIRAPAACRAHTACSRDDPQPKFSRAMTAHAPSFGT